MERPHQAGIDYDTILDSIMSEKCVLFTGPELYTDENGVSFEDQLNNYLKIDEDPGVRYYEDGLFFFQPRSRKTSTYTQIKRFYRQSFPKTEQVFEKIAHIPFHLIVNITPDKKLLEVYKRLNFRCNFNFYWKNQTADPKIRKPNRANPMIYNLLGSIDRQESLILTHDDLFDYFESIFQGKSLSSVIKHHIMKEAKNFIFLGIPFDKWYMQLILRILHLHKDQMFINYAASQMTTANVKTLCYEHFNINFIGKNIENFLDELHEECQDAGILKQRGEKKPSVVGQLRDWLVQDEIEKVFQGLSDFLYGQGEAGKEFINRLFILMNRSKRLNRKLDLGIIDAKEAEIKSNKILNGLLGLLDEVQELE